MPGLEPFASHASAILQWLLITSASATLIACVVLIVQKMFSGWLTPGGRQRLWVLVIVRLLLPILPASAFSIANLKFEMLWTSAHQEVHSELASDQSMVTPTVHAESADEAHHVVPAPIVAPTRSWSAVAWIAAFATWAIVVIAMLGRLLWVNRAMSIRLCRAVVVNDQPTIQLVRTCAQNAGLRSVPAIVMTDAVATPAVHGIWRPRILMPTALLESLTPTQRRHVILHELSHIRHHDVLGNWLLAILNITHWFNPLLWLTFARIKSDRELARDAWVIRVMAGGDHTPDATGYADTLVDLAQRLNVRYVAVPLPALFGRTTSLRRRLQMIERVSESRRGSRLLGIALMFAIAGGLLTRARAQSVPDKIAAPGARSGAAKSAPDTQSLSVAALKSSARGHLNNDEYNAAINELEAIRQIDPSDEYAREILPFIRQIPKSMDDEMAQRKLYRLLPTVKFDAVGFGDVIDFIRDILGMKIDVDWKVLEAAGVTKNTPVSANLRNVPAEAALRPILNQAGGNVKLGYDIEAGVLKITTEAALRNDIVVRTYDIHDLLGPAQSETANDNFARNYRRGQLLTHIRDFVDRNTWKDNGGDIGSLHADGDQLIVTQRLATHQRIVEVLDALRAERSKKEQPMSFLDIANSNAGVFLQWLLLASASATLIAGVVLIVQKLFSRWTTPAGRQRLWWLVVARLLLPVLPASAISIANIPVAKLWVKAHREPAPAAIAEHRDPSKYVTTIRMGPIPASPAPTIQLTPTVQLAPEPAHADLTWVLIVSIWLVISMALLARLIWVNHAMARRLRSALEITDPSILNLVRECASAAGLRRTPRIVETTAVGTPAVYGVWQPRILMPAGLMQSLPEAQRRHVILHELSHIRYQDVFANWLLAVLAICHWFNPLLWLAMSRLKTDRELARDACVIRFGSRSDDEASTYADTLIDLAQRLSLGRSSRFELTAPIPGLFGRSTSLRRRLLMIQHLSTRRGSNLIGFVLLLLIAGGFLTRARAQETQNLKPQNTIEPPITAPASQPTNEKDRQRDVADLARQIQTKINRTDYKEALTDTVRLLVLDPKNDYARGLRPLLEDKVNAPQPAASKDLRWDIGELTRQLSNAVGRGDDAAALVWADRLLQRDPGNAYAKEEQRVLASRVPALDMQRALARVLPQVHFDQVGFEDVVEFLRDISGANIFVNWKVLDAAGIDRNTPVTANVHNVKFSKALDLILDSVGGGKTKVRYSIDQNVVTISTKEDVDKGHISIRVYDIRDLLVSESAGPSRQQLMDAVQKLIMQNVDSETWKENNGHVGSLRIFEPSGQLIVTQTPENHRQIVALLDRVREERNRQILLETEIYDCDSAELAKQMETWAPTTQPASKGIVVSAEQVEPHLVELKRNRQVSSLPSPRVTLFNGQQASVTTSIQKKYATDYTRVRLPNGIVRYDPIEQTIDPGVQIDLQATLTADRKSVVLSIHPKVTTLVAMAEERWKGTKDYQLYVEKPQLSVAETKALVSVPEGKILLMTVAQPDRKHTLLVVVKPTIVQLAAIEQKPVPVEQLVRPEDKSVDLSSHYPWMDKHQPTSAPDVVPDNVRRINGSR